MGCTSTASILTVTFNSTKKTPKQKFSDYSALRAWISNEFLELREKAYKLQVYQKPSIKIKNAFDYYSLLKKYSGELNLEAIIEKSKRYKPEIFGKITPSIFKIRKGKDDVEAVGFFLSPRLCLIGISENVNDYHALFEDGSSLSFKEDGVFIVVGAGLAIAELELTNQWILNTVETKPILLDEKNDYEQAVLLFYSKSRPVLQEFIGSYKVSGHFASFDEKMTRECVCGAPLLSDSGKVFAVYTGKGLALFVSEIIKTIESEMDNLDLSLQEAVDEAFVLSKINVKTQNITKNHLSGLSAYMDLNNSSLILCQNESFTEYKGIDAKDGSVLIFTPFGIVITGCDVSGNRKKSWIFTENKISYLPDMNKSHLYHSSIFFDNKIFVISGKYTNFVETFDSKSNKWLIESQLPEKISYSNVLAEGNSLYLFGGRVSKEVSRKIYKFTDNQWVLCEFSLPKPIFGIGIIRIFNTDILIFGGKGPYDKFNHNTWIFSLNKGTCQDFQKFTIKMTFGWYPTAEIKNDIIVFSNNGEKVRYNKLEHQLFV